MTKVTPLCMAGKHVGPEMDFQNTEDVTPPQHWRLVPVSMGEDGEFTYDADGDISVCCPEHHFPGEPDGN